MLSRRKIEQYAKDREAKRAAQRAALMVPSRSLHRGTYSGGVSGEAVPKEDASQHAGYTAAVRALGYCMHCLRTCFPQFCHRDCGKGGGIKTDVREGWPGCDECHGLLGGHNGGGRMPKEQRRALELDLARRTREAVIAAGTWPKDFPMWEESAPSARVPG